MSSELNSNHALDAPQFLEQRNLNAISDEEYKQMIHDILSQQNMNPSQTPTNGSLDLTGFDAHEMQNTDPISLRHSVNTITNDLLPENRPFLKTPVPYPQSLEMLVINGNTRSAHLSKRPNPPYLLSDYPGIPVSDGFNMSLQPYPGAIDSVPLLREQIPDTIPDTPHDFKSTVISCDNIHDSVGDRALQSLPDSPSLAASFLSNYEQFQRLNIHNTVCKSPDKPISGCQNPQSGYTDDRFILNPPGGTAPSNEEPSRDYFPPTRPRGRPRGRPRMRSHVLFSHISHRSQKFQVRCDWEGKCDAYVNADHVSVSRHIRLHIANELFKAVSSVDGGNSNVRYIFNPSRSGLGSQFKLENVKPEVRVRMVLESGKVWAKCMWGSNGCCHGRGELTLEYLPKHVCYMHLGLAKY